MPKITVKSAVQGDVLARDVVIEEVVLFEAGTVLVKKHIEILTILKVETVDIESRDRMKFSTIKEAHKNIDKRFSYVEDNSFMMSLKNLVKDIISNMGA